MSENVQKRIKKKRTIANLLQTEQSMSIPNEKKTYIKEYFEQCSTPPKTPESTAQTDFLSPMSNSSKNETEFAITQLETDNVSTENISPINSEASESLKNAKKSKVKDYVFDNTPKILKGTILKMTNSQINKNVHPTIESSIKSFQRKRITRVSKRKSKIKDYIVPLNESQNEPNLTLEMENTKPDDKPEQENPIEIIKK